MATTIPDAGREGDSLPPVGVAGPSASEGLRTASGDEDALRQKVETLRRLPLWEVFSEDVLRAVAGKMETLSYEPGEPIIRRGEQGRHFSVMVSGRADVRILDHSGTVATVATMKAGDSFGEMSLLGEDVTSADVIAVERCETLALGRH